MAITASRSPFRFPRLVAVAALAAAAPPQDTAPAPRERALAKVRQQLEQKPTHPQLFEYYFKALVANNAVDAEVGALTADLAKDPGQAALSIILGRLYLRTDREAKALEVLDAIAAKTPAIWGVLGDIYQKLGRHDQAARAFTASLPAAVTSEAKGRLYELIGKSQLALGHKAAALLTWQQIAALDDGKFHRRMRVAELLTEARLFAEAEAAYPPLLAESESDPAQHCRVLREFGRLQELQGRLDPALATYEAILAKTARGNWMRKDIEGRVLQIHRRLGKLDDLVARLQEQRRDQPDDLATTELLADVLLETRKRDQAVAVLAEAAPRFPNDVRLARKLAQLYVDAGNIERAIAEYQRILVQKPDELELYLELGQLFARGSQFDEAKLQWEKALAQRLQDASLCARLAGMYAAFEREADAVRLFERALEIEPEAMPRYTELADYLFGRGRTEAGAAVLERAFATAQGRPRRLEAIAGTLRERGLVAQARGALEAILAAEPHNQENRYALADLLLELKETEPARELLWQIVDGDADGSSDGQRTRAANTLVQLAARSGAVEQLAAEAGTRDSAGAAFVLGRIHSRNRDFDRAVASFRTVLERRPEDVEARRLLARLLADLGDYPAALAEYEKVAQLKPGEGKRQFREVARLYLETYDLDRAVAVWQKAMRDNPDNAAVFVEVGREFLDVQRVPEALEAFQQAARLRADDPDIQLRLADALQRAGKPDEAERALLHLATHAADARDREQARSRLHQLYGEQGTLDQRIDALATTVAESPYDQDAPQLLADLYLKTGDYVLGLEVIDRVLQFQPKNVELLQRRVEILEALEDWDKARAAHQELLQLPGTERDVHLAGIGQALYELGQAAEAKATFAKIQDRGRVVAFYEKYELRGDAVAFFERAIKRVPGDVRNYVALARQLMELNRSDEAIAVLERALQVRAGDRRTLELLGQLYVQAGRRDDAVHCGMRLFGLRGEDTEKTRREEYEEEQSRNARYGRSSYGFGYGYSTSFSAQRYGAAQTYFTERGLQDEWGKILVAEAKRRPADEYLFSQVRSHFGWRDKSPAKLAAFVDELLARDWAHVHLPPGYTLRAYQAMLESARLGVYAADNATAQARVAALAGAARSTAEVVERAWLQQKLGQLPAAEADLRLALQQDPGHAIAMTLLADLLLEAKQHAEAAAWIEKLAAWWQTDAGEAATAELTQRASLEFQRGRRSAYDQFPRKLRAKVDDTFLLELQRQTRSRDGWSKPSTLSFPEAAPSRFSALLKLLRTHRAAADEAAFARTLATAVAEADTLARRSALGTLLFEEQRKAEAEPLLEGVLALEDQVKRDPLRTYAWSAYRTHFDEAARCLGLLRAEQGQALLGYALLRGHGQAQQAELVLRKQADVAEVRRMLEGDVASAGDRLRELRQAGAGDLLATELDYRDQVIELADFLLGEKDFAAVDALYQGALELLPDDLEIRAVLAALRLRQGEADRALAMHEEILEVKRRKRRAWQVDAVLPPSRLQPTLPDDGSSNSGGVTTYVSGGVVYRSSGSRTVVASLETADTYRDILAIHTKRSDSAGILATLTRMQREDPRVFRDMSYQLVQQIQNLDLGKNQMSILRALRSAVADNTWLLLEYGRACLAADEVQEAKRSLERLLLLSKSSEDYYTQEGERLLEQVAQRTGEAKLGVAELAARVAAEPDNMRHRTKLVQKLLLERRYAEALKHAEVVVAKAPHMAKAKEQLINAACAAGEDERAKEMLAKLFTDTGKPEEKLQRGVAYANWLFAEGAREASFAIVEGLDVKAGGSSGNQFSAGNWFLDRHELARATKLLAVELEKNKTQSWQADRIRPRLARTELASGAVEAAVSRHLEAIATAPSLADREQRFKDMLGALTATHAPAALAAALSAHEARATVADLLVMTALDFARGDTPAAIVDIERALELSNKDVYLFPLLYGLKKLYADYEGALAVLERMATSYGGSDSMRWTGTSSISERDQIKIERASLLDELGRREAADALIETLHDATKPATMLTVANAMKDRKRYDQALAWRRRYFDKAGPRDADALCDEVEILLLHKKVEEALPLLAEARLMAKAHERARTLTEQAHRQLGRLPALIADLEREHGKDPRDAAVRDQLLRLYAELRQQEPRLALYREMLAQPETKVVALEALIAEAERSGEVAGQIELLQQLLALKGGREKKQVHARLAEAFLRAADADHLERARSHLEQSLEMETAQGQVQLGGWLSTHGPADAARAAFAAALELAPDDEGALGGAAGQAWRDRDWARFLELRLELLDKQAGGSGGLATPTVRLELLDALHSLAQKERAPWTAGDGDVLTKERAGVLASFAGDRTRARALLEAAFAADPRRPLVLAQLLDLARSEQRTEDVLAWTQRLHDVIERRHVVRADWNVRWGAQNLWQEIGRWQYALGRADLAEAIWRTPGLRRSPVSSGSGSYRYDWNVPYAAEQWLRCAAPERALSALDREFLVHENPPWETYWNALVEAGREAEALASAWQRLLDPLRLYGVRDQSSRSWSWDEITGESAPQEPSVGFLVSVHRRRNALGELMARIDELAEKPECRLGAEELRRAVIAAGDDWRARAELAEAALADDDGNANTRLAAAFCRARAGDAEAALAHLGELFDLDGPALRQPRRTFGGMRTRQYDARPALSGKRNPFSFSFQTSSSTTWYSSSYDDFESRRARAVVVLHLAGRTEKADEVVRDLVDQAAPGARRSQVHQQLGAQFAAAEAWVPAVAHFKLAIAEMPEAERQQSWVQQQLLRAGKRAGDAALRQELLGEERARLERAVAEAGFRQAYGERLALARFLIHERVDPARGLDLLQALEQAAGCDELVEGDRVVALRLLGRAGEAVALHEARAQRGRALMRAAFRPEKPVEQVEFGLALAAAGDAARARAILEPALAELRRMPKARTYAYGAYAYTDGSDPDSIPEVEAALQALK